MTKILIPAALALGVFAVTGTGVVASVGVANAHSESCETTANYNNKRYNCETRHVRRRAILIPPPTPDPEIPVLKSRGFVAPSSDLPADPGGGGGGGRR